MGIDLQPCDWHIDRKDVRYRNLGKFLCYFIREYGTEDKRRKLYDELKIAYMFRILDGEEDTFVVWLDEGKDTETFTEDFGKLVGHCRTLMGWLDDEWETGLTESFEEIVDYEFYDIRYWVLSD